MLDIFKTAIHEETVEDENIDKYFLDILNQSDLHRYNCNTMVHK